ncbi:unnamed protein product [Arabidopsis halleri]
MRMNFRNFNEDSCTLRYMEASPKHGFRSIIKKNQDSDLNDEDSKTVSSSSFLRIYWN